MVQCITKTAGWTPAYSGTVHHHVRLLSLQCRPHDSCLRPVRLRPTPAALCLACCTAVSPMRRHSLPEAQHLHREPTARRLSDVCMRRPQHRPPHRAADVPAGRAADAVGAGADAHQDAAVPGDHLLRRAAVRGGALMDQRCASPTPHRSSVCCNGTCSSVTPSCWGLLRDCSQA